MLTNAQRNLLLAIGRGEILKDHRDIEGAKWFRLYSAADNFASGLDVDEADVQALVDAGLIDSNKKFPAATYWLTDAGRARL